MYLDLSKRVREYSEEMEGEDEARNYFKSHILRHGKHDSSYDLVCKDLFSKIKIKKGNVLDVGCGYGGLIKQINTYIPDSYFVGVDLSKSMLEIGKKYLKGLNCRLIHVPAHKIPFKKETFDLTVCNDTFHHFNSPIAVLKELLRVTKKNGFIYIIDLNRSVNENLIHRISQKLSEANLVNATQYFDSVRASFTVKEMREIINKSGSSNFKIVKGKPKNHEYMSGHWIAVIRKS